MTLSDMADLGTLASSVAVVASLLYLSIQVRQSAVHQQGVMGQGRAQTLQEMVRAISASPQHMEVMLRGWAGDPTLNRVLFNQFYWSCYSVFVTFEDTYHQRADGMIGRPAYHSALRAMEMQLSQPGVRAAWRIARDTFEPGFVAFIDSLAGDAHGPAISDRWEVWKKTVAA